MSAIPTIRRRAALAQTAGFLLLAAGASAGWAQGTASSLYPPSWAQGRTVEQAASTLAPNPPGLTAMPGEEIPLNKIKLPKGFEISLWAEGLPNAREMVIGPKGTVFASTRFVGNVYAIVDRGGKREVKIIAKGLNKPNGVAIKNGALYVAELSRIIRYDDIENRLDNPPAPVVVLHV